MERPVLGIRPLLAHVEAADASLPARRREAGDRDDDVLMLLRRRLRERTLGNADDTQAGDDAHAGEDKYEPQRLGRKICWQYDSSARRVPILRRPYI